MLSTPEDGDEAFPRAVRRVRGFIQELPFLHDFSEKKIVPCQALLKPFWSTDKEINGNLGGDGMEYLYGLPRFFSLARHHDEQVYIGLGSRRSRRVGTE